MWFSQIFNQPQKFSLLNLLNTMGDIMLKTGNFPLCNVFVYINNIITSHLLLLIYRWLSVFIYTVFLFLVITVLLNLLIAQMSDTYANIQSDAQRALFINRAWIVAKAEYNSLFAAALFVRFI